MVLFYSKIIIFGYKWEDLDFASPGLCRAESPSDMKDTGGLCDFSSASSLTKKRVSRTMAGIDFFSEKLQ
jgi:hypothetical protein